jgi:hypothetical protein
MEKITHSFYNTLYISAFFLGIVLLLVLKHVLESYFFKGVKKGDEIIYNKPITYEITLSLIWVGLALLSFSSFMEKSWEYKIFEIIFIGLFISRAVKIFKSRNAEIRLAKHRVYIKDASGNEMVINEPKGFEIETITSDEVSITGKSKSLALTVKDEQEHIVNLDALHLSEFRSALIKDIKRIYGTEMLRIESTLLEKILKNKKAMVLYILFALVLTFVFQLMS